MDTSSRVAFECPAWCGAVPTECLAKPGALTLKTASGLPSLQTSTSALARCVHGDSEDLALSNWPLAKGRNVAPPAWVETPRRNPRTDALFPIRPLARDQSCGQHVVTNGESSRKPIT